MHLRKILLFNLVLCLTFVCLHGCEQDEPIRPDRNRPPETILSVAPQIGDRAFHKYLVRWAGLDRDGIVVAYRVATVSEDELYGGRTTPEDIVEYLIDLEWTTTDATESLFVFRADRPNSRSHSVYVVAVDNEGKEDPSPARTNFLAIDYQLPEPVIFFSNTLNTIPHPVGVAGDTLPAYNTLDPGTPIWLKFEWQGVDPDGEVVYWKYRLDSGPIVTVGADTTEAEFTYDPDHPAESDILIGFHEFRLWAVDDANAESSKKMAKFIVNYDPDTVIDSIWTFRRKTDRQAWNNVPLPEKLIYARAWRDSPEVYQGVDRVAYHFGQLRIKFHGSDRDKQPDSLPPSFFKWDIAGTLLKSDWVSKGCKYPDTLTCFWDTTTHTPYLDSDQPFRLSVRARDELGKADGSPDSVWFLVNVAPKIVDGSLIYTVLNAETGRVRFNWDVIDPDEGYNWGSSQGESEQALVKYRYSLDGGVWQQDGINKTSIDPIRYNKRVVIEGLESGPHVFILHAYNGDFFETRADKDTLYFEL
jgi:hypothetical protein